MENNKAPLLWDQKKDPPKELRMPNNPVNVLLRDESKNCTNSRGNVERSQMTASQEHTREVAIKSTLSADAPEFYPSNYNRNSAVSNTGTSVQNRLKKHRISEPNVNNIRQEDCFEHDSDNEFINTPDDIRLRHLIATLTKDPGQYSDLVDIFMDTIYPYFEDVVVLSRAAQLLVEQAINCPSFRYTAARLCCYIEQYCAEFRATLHLTCQKELQKNLNKSGLILFVAELYTQLHHENIYGTYLIEAFKHLLNIGGNENVKSVCQALKLTGYSLELYNKKALDEVFVKMNDIKPSVTGTPRSLIDSVINLRSQKWGHNSPPVNSSNIEPENHMWNVPSTVFYGSDGSRFTSEENEFLAANMLTNEEYFTDTSDPDELCDPEPEMDEEIQAAFKDFVKLSKR